MQFSCKLFLRVLSHLILHIVMVYLMHLVSIAANSSVILRKWLVITSKHLFFQIGCTWSTFTLSWNWSCSQVGLIVSFSFSENISLLNSGIIRFPLSLGAHWWLGYLIIWRSWKPRVSLWSSLSVILVLVSILVTLEHFVALNILRYLWLRSHRCWIFIGLSYEIIILKFNGWISIGSSIWFLCQPSCSLLEWILILGRHSW